MHATYLLVFPLSHPYSPPSPSIRRILLLFIFKVLKHLRADSPSSTSIALWLRSRS